MDEHGDEIDWDDMTEEDWRAMDRANDEVGREERDPDSLGSLPERADAAADILGGVVGERALEALGGAADGQAE